MVIAAINFNLARIRDRESVCSFGGLACFWEWSIVVVVIRGVR